MSHSTRFVMLLLLVVLIIAAPACQRAAEDKLAPFISTATVERGSLSHVIHMAGEVSALNATEIMSPVSGVTVREVLVEVGTAVEEGQPLMQLDTTVLDRTLREAEADLVVAQTRLNQALRKESDVELDDARAQVAQAQAAFDKAELDLAVAKKLALQPLERQVEKARADLQAAQDRLQMAEWSGNGPVRDLIYKQAFHQRQVRDLKPGPKRTEAEQALERATRDLEQAQSAQEASVRAARQAVLDAELELGRLEARLKRARAGQEDPYLAARLALEQTRTTLERAKQQLARLEAGEESDTLQTARTMYEAAQAKVDQAKADIEAATVRAPFKGIVLAVYTQPGQRLTTNSTLAYVADLTSLQVRAQVTEREIPRLAIDQAVRISFDALPGQFFPGKVLSLPPSGETRGGIGYYEVVTSLETEEPLIRLGMLANVRVIIGEKTDALIIPAAALQFRPNGETYVTVQANGGQRQERTIKIGINDGIMVEVLDGLTEGETVVISLVPQTQPQGPVFLG